MNPPLRYSFVNAGPQTKAEKRKTRTAIRSHIGRWTQEKQQKLDVNPSSTSEKESPSNSSRIASLSPVPSGGTQSQSLDQSGGVWLDVSSDSRGEKSARGNSAEDDDVDVDNQGALVVADLAQLRREHPPVLGNGINSSIQVLGTGTLDPFQTYPSKFSPALVSQCHEYCK